MVEYTIDLRFRGFEIVENRWISENCYHRSDQQFVLGDEGFESTNRIYVWTIEGQRNFFKCLSVLDSGNIYVYLSSNLGDFESSPQFGRSHGLLCPLYLPETQSDLDETGETWNGWSTGRVALRCAQIARQGLQQVSR